MGFRAIRYCLKNRELFKTQLRAILRASAFGDIKIMFPLITCLEELRAGKALVEEVKNELRLSSVSEFNENIEVGCDRRCSGTGGRLLLHRYQRPHRIHHVL